MLQQLRSTTDSLDSRIKTTLSSLADLRSELIKSTPLSLPSEKKAAKPVDADELLRFAQQIARPAPPAAQSGAESQPVQYQQPAVSVETSIKRESPGPPLPNAVLDSRTAEAGGLEQQTAGASHGVGTGQGRAVDALRPQFREWLEQGSRQSTELPWADQNIFVKSALNRLQEAEADTQT